MMVASRNFGIEVDKVKTDALVPLADMLNHRVQVFTKAGAYVRTLGGNGEEDGNDQFNGPDGVAVDPSEGRLYVCDGENSRVQVFLLSL